MSEPPKKKLVAKKKIKVRRLLYLRARIRGCPRCGPLSVVEVACTPGHDAYMECVSCRLGGNIPVDEAIAKIRAALPKEKPVEATETGQADRS